MNKLSLNQRRALAFVKLGNPYHGCDRQCDYDGRTSTLWSLKRRGLIALTPDGWILTDEAGKPASRHYQDALAGHAYAYCKRALGWMNQGMVDLGKRDWWAQYYLANPDRQHGPALAVAFIGFCDKRGNFLPEEIIQAHAGLIVGKS